MKVQVRILTADDYAAVSRLLRASHEWLARAEGLGPAETDWLAEHQSSPEAVEAACKTHSCLVAFAGETAVGFIAIRGNHIELLFVDPAWRGQDMGHSLFRAAQRLVAGAGFDGMSLGAVGEAVPFYEAMGMRREPVACPTGIPGHEVLLMRKHMGWSNEMTKLAIDPALCRRCGACAVTCSEGILAQPERGKPPQVSADARCIACGHCVAICPEGAIRHEAYPPESVHPLRDALAPSAEQVMELLRARRSVRLFRQTPVQQEVVDAILEGARLAPAAHNIHDTEYMIVRDAALRRELTQAMGTFYGQLARRLRNPVLRVVYRLAVGGAAYRDIIRMQPDFEFVAQQVAAGNDPFLHDAPCILIAHAPKSINFPEANAMIALHNATLVAQSLGVGSFLVGYLVAASHRLPAIPRLLGIPPSHAIYAALALGYPKIPYHNWIQRAPLKVTER